MYPSLALAVTIALGQASLDTDPAAQSALAATESRPSTSSGEEAEVLDRVRVVGERTGIDVGDRVERGQAMDVRELFTLDPAIDVGGGTRNGQRLYLRGVEGSNLRITVDGAPQGQNLYNHRGGLVNIDPELLRQVDVAPGPAPADGGPGALGGSLRFETIDAQDRLRPGNRLGGLLRLGTASATDAWRGSVAGFAMAGPSTGLLAHVAGTDYDDLRVGGGGRVPFSEGRDRSGLFKLSVLGDGPHALRVSLERHRASGYNFMQRGDYPWQVQPPTAQRPPQDQTLTRDTAVADYRFADGTPWNDWKLRASRSRNDFFAPDSNGERFISTVRSLDLRNTLRASVAGGELATTLGADFEDEDGRALRTPQPSRFDTGSRNRGLFVQSRLSSGPLFASLGVRQDRYRTDYGPRESRGSETSVNGALELELIDGLSAFAGYGESARGRGNIPLQFTRNTVPGLTFNGAADGRLRAERGRQSEAGLRYAVGPALGAHRLDIGATAYLTRIDDAIVFNQPGTGGLGGRPLTDFSNLDAAIRYSGYELRAGWARGLYTGTAAYSDTRIRNLPTQPQFLARAGAPTGKALVWDNRFEVAPQLTLGYTLRAQEGIDSVPDGQAVFVPRPGYTLHDIQLVWRPSRVQGLDLAFAVLNAGDKRYSNQTTFTQQGFATEEAGRDVRLTVGYRF